MRRFLTPPLALLAGLAVLLTACSGESPTAPNPPGGGKGGACNVTITLNATSVTPTAGSAVIVRATVKRDGAAVPDGTSVVFTTDLGFFLENGLPSVSKVTVGGFADVTLASLSPGTSHVRATFDCGTNATPLAVEFQVVPANGPFISSIFPSQGTCAGGDTVTINGGKFGSNASTTRVTFGGAPATIVSVSDTQIVVKTPARTLQNPEVPEQVDIVVTLNAGTAGLNTVTAVKGFTYTCVNPNTRIFISSVIPNSGSPAGGETVVVHGGHFGTSIATTRVTFCGVSATIVSQTDSTITVLTPRHQLANPAISETCDVGVTIDLGLVSQQSAVLPQAFTYRGAGPGGECPTSVGTFISAISPNTGGGEGGTSVTISGGGFTSDLAHTRVEFGGVPGTVTSVSPGSITVTTPQHTLANPQVPEPVTVRVVIDVGGQNQVCASLANGFIYTQTALQPTINSTSPRTGPNDTSTRVTIFGSNFQFPLQVFVNGGSCSAPVEAQVVSIKFDEVVFLTPIALNGNSCLANSTVSVTVTNPYTGKTATLPQAFRYYTCPTISSNSPTQGSYLGGDRVVINGQNFEEPVTVTIAGVTAQVVSVSASSIVAITRQPANLTCADIQGPIVVTSDALPASCVASGGTFTYLVSSLASKVTAITPNSVPQAGSDIVITGTNFIDPNMQVKFDFAAVGGQARTVTPTSITPTAITVTAPPFEGNFKTQACTVTGGGAGTMRLPTNVPVTVINPTTTCPSTPTNLLYIPDDTSCIATTALSITSSATLPADTTCAAYSFTFTATGGIPPYTWAVTGAPAGLSVDSATGVLSGTPSTNGTFGISVTVTDTSATPKTATQAATLTISGCP